MLLSVLVHTPHSAWWSSAECVSLCHCEYYYNIPLLLSMYSMSRPTAAYTVLGSPREHSATTVLMWLHCHSSFSLQLPPTCPSPSLATSHGVTTITSTVSVGDYFKQKMAAVKKTRCAATAEESKPSRKRTKHL